MTSPSPAPCPQCGHAASVVVGYRQTQQAIRRAKLPAVVVAAVQCGRAELVVARCRKLSCRHTFVLTSVADLPEGVLARVQIECPRCGHSSVINEDEAAHALTCPACGFEEREPGDIEGKPT